MPRLEDTRSSDALFMRRAEAWQGFVIREGIGLALLVVGLIGIAQGHLGLLILAVPGALYASLAPLRLRRVLAATPKQATTDVDARLRRITWIVPAALLAAMLMTCGVAYGLAVLYDPHASGRAKEIHVWIALGAIVFILHLAVVASLVIAGIRGTRRPRDT